MSRWTWWRTTRTTRTTQTAAELQGARCPLGAPMLQSYLDGQLEAPAAARVRTHVAECHRCARELAVYQRIERGAGRPRGDRRGGAGPARDFAESLAERESREPGTEAAPTT
ncbi:Putative zinc-finger domain-containing protein OS=Streptomyces antimycoticus OX=68175 GN=SANT12839_046420 PE=4 SV=1 [Streptomyces antimycoticus]